MSPPIWWWVRRLKCFALDHLIHFWMSGFLDFWISVFWIVCMSPPIVLPVRILNHREEDFFWQMHGLTNKLVDGRTESWFIRQDIYYERTSLSERQRKLLSRGVWLVVSLYSITMCFRCDLCVKYMFGSCIHISSLSISIKWILPKRVNFILSNSGWVEIILNQHANLRPFTLYPDFISVTG